MSFIKYLFTPQLYKDYSDGQKFYEPGSMEKLGDQILSTLNIMWSLSCYSSPFIITYLYRRGYFVAESLLPAAKLSTGIGILVAVTLCIRSIGRSQSKSYTKFVTALESAKINGTDTNNGELRRFDFDFKYWPIDSVAVQGGKSTVRVEGRSSRIATLPCEIIAYIAFHTFGLRMIYPGSMKLIQTFLYSALVEGRTKLITEHNAKRYKLLTSDRNDIDVIFVNNRNKSSNGRTLVICSEGNAGFYEIGIMTTPLSLNYSVLGWNHPGFGGSTGQPYPEQEHNAIDAVMQFAIDHLNFVPENILLFGWSIGGYTTLYAAKQYPDVKGLILDATFDDVLHLALPRMPECLSGIVRIVIREYINLHNAHLASEYNGPILMIRRTQDEVISEDFVLATNRGNSLAISILKTRFPNIFQPEQIEFVTKLLNNPLDTHVLNLDSEQLSMSLLMSYTSEQGKSYPMEIGNDFTNEERNQLAEFLIRKHLIDFKSSHCTPLPTNYFQIPWDIPTDDEDFVFT